MSLAPLVLCSLTVLALLSSGWAAILCEIVEDDPCVCVFKDVDGSTALVDINHYFEYP